MFIARQGDVLVKQIRKRTPTGKDARERGRIILAHGEVTGHAHEVIAADPTTDVALPAAQFFEEPDGRRFLMVARACVLTHQEHGVIAIPPGCYEVTRQKEYSPAEIRDVAD
jgi:hypothetical protein